MESRTKNKQSREQIERMTRRAFGVGLAPGDEALAEMREGWFNATYGLTLVDGRRTVLKIAPPPDVAIMSYERNLIATEVAAMRLVSADPRIPVPEIYAFDEARQLCNAPYFFMAWLTGENLEHVKDALAPDVQKKIRFEIGAIMHAIHAVTGSYFGYPGNLGLQADNWRRAFSRIVDSVLGDGQARNVDYGVPQSELRDLFNKHAPALEEVRTPCLVHWDAWDSNFFVTDGRVTGLLDFERALWADPLMEAQFRPFFGAFGADILRGYGKTLFTPNEERRSFLYMWHLGLVMVTECAYRNYDTDRVYRQGRRILKAAMEWLSNSPGPE